MRLLTRVLMGLALGAGGIWLWFVSFGEVLGPPAYAIGAAAVGVSLLGNRLPGLNGLVIGVVVGGIVGTVWLQASIQSGMTLPGNMALPGNLLPENVLPPNLHPPSLLLVYLLLPAATFGLAGFVLGRRLGPAPLFVIGLAVAGSAILLPQGQDRFTILTGYVVAPVVIAVLAALGTNVRRPSRRVQE